MRTMELCNQMPHLYKDIVVDLPNLRNFHLKGNWVECSGENIVQVEGNDSDEEDDDTPQEAYELRTGWMLLAEMMANRQTRSLDDFSARDIDRNHNESLLRYPEIEEAESFIQQAIGNN
ncbi:hypothetical protein RirG_048520 [Rhizophagus irregularis DAOM 197198w]|uniref:Uncharacterized protein n=1 Tax=Rhizophagus irregularis (strain DAOM 197198w) TaxID=1432141 RepID=A0A015N6C4_RHIIW|nr:hypothetical protein RirG_048520 [Rhizophagus irregularis DAOM 197198w]